MLITTNFDTLLEDAIRPALDPDAPARLTVLDPESSARAAFTLATDARPLLMKIHGDLGAVTVKNTTAELAEQDELLRAATSWLLGRYGLLVAGYSGRDPAVMAMLRDVLAQPTPYPGGLTWVRRPEDTLADEVARPAGRRPRRRGGTGARGGGERDDGADGRDRAGRRPAARGSPRTWPSTGPAPLRYPAPLPSGPAGAYPQVRLAALPLLSVPDQARLLEDPAGLPLRTLRQALKAGGPAGRWPAGPAASSSRSATTPGSPRRWPGHGVQVTGTAVPVGPGQGRRGTRQHRPGAHRRGARPGAGPDPRHDRGAARPGSVTCSAPGTRIPAARTTPPPWPGCARPPAAR